MGSCLSRGAVAQNQVLPEFDNPPDYLGQRGYTKSVKGKDGANLLAYFWPADPSVPLKGIIQLAHGSAAYTCFDYLRFKAPGQPNVYDGSWVQAFNRSGFSVCGLDQQGSGRSKASQKAPKKFQSHVDNLLSLTDSVAEEGGEAFRKGLPYFLVGHCVGGLAAALACVQQPGRFAGLVLLSPLLSAEPGGSLRPPSKVTPKTDGECTPSEPAVPPWISEAWAADPYVTGAGDRPPHLEVVQPAAEQLCGGGDGGEGAMVGLALPLLIFQSDRDSYASPEGAKKLHEKAASTDKTLRSLSLQWHVLTKEEGWEELLSETTAWLAARATNSGSLTRNPFEGPAGAPAAAAAPPPPPQAADAAAAAPPPQPEQPVLTRSMSMLERLPEHEPLLSRSDMPRGSGAGNGPGGALPVRRYSFSGRLPRAGDSPASLLGPLPPLGPRRSLGQLPPELSQYKLRGRLPPLPPLPPLLDKKPIQ